MGALVASPPIDTVPPSLGMKLSGTVCIGMDTPCTEGGIRCIAIGGAIPAATTSRGAAAGAPAAGMAADAKPTVVVALAGADALTTGALPAAAAALALATAAATNAAAAGAGANGCGCGHGSCIM